MLLHGPQKALWDVSWDLYPVVVEVDSKVHGVFRASGLIVAYR